MPSRERPLTLDDVVDVATELADEAGLEACTLSAVAKRLGIRTPSLYHHVDGLEGLRRAVRRRGLEHLADALRDAATGRAGPDALRALARAYLTFARRHPGSYAATVRAPGEHDDPAAERLSEGILATSLAVLRGYGIEGDEAVHAARFVRSTLHGFVALERAEGFGLPQDADTSAQRLIDAVDAGLAAFGAGRVAQTEPGPGSA